MSAVNTDGMTPEQIQVQLEIMNSPQAHLLCLLTQPEPLPHLQAAFMTSSDPAKLPRCQWRREDNGLQPDRKHWKFVTNDGTHFDINMSTWLGEEHSKRVAYANSTSSEARTKAKKEPTTLPQGSPSVASSTHRSAPAPPPPQPSAPPQQQPGPSSLTPPSLGTAADAGVGGNGQPGSDVESSGAQGPMLSSRYVTATAASSSTRADPGIELMFMNAAKAGNNSELATLLDAHPWLQSVVDEQAMTALHWAATKGRETTIHFLLVHGAAIDGIAKGRTTALHLAAHVGHLPAVKRLLSAQAQINLKNQTGCTALDLARSEKHYSLASVLRSAETDDGLAQICNEVRKGGNTEALLELATAGDQGGVSRMLDARVPIESADAFGCTALHHAAANGRLGTVELLLHRHANLNATNSYLSTPLHMAVVKGNIGTAKLLVAASAQLDIRNGDLATPLDLAKLQGFTGVEGIIKRAKAGAASLEALKVEVLPGYATEMAARQTWDNVLHELRLHAAQMDSDRAQPEADRKQLQHAESILDAAQHEGGETDLHTLETAVDVASRLGAEPALIEPVCTLIENIKRKLVSEAELESFCRKPRQELQLQPFQDAINAAKAAGVDNSLVTEAQVLSGQIEQSRRQCARALETLSTTVPSHIDVDSLEVALQDAKAEGLLMSPMRWLRHPSLSPIERKLVVSKNLESSLLKLLEDRATADDDNGVEELALKLASGGLLTLEAVRCASLDSWASIDIEPDLAYSLVRAAYYQVQASRAQPAVHVTGYVEFKGHTVYTIETELPPQSFRTSDSRVTLATTPHIVRSQHRVTAFRQLHKAIINDMPPTVSRDFPFPKLLYHTQTIKETRTGLLQTYLRAILSACYDQAIPAEMQMSLIPVELRTFMGLEIPTEMSTSNDGSVWVYPDSRMEWGRVLGRGRSATVLEVRNSAICGGSSMAGKRIQVLDITERESAVSLLRREFRVLSTLEHPNIVRLFGIVLDHPDYLALIMELTPLGSLRGHLNQFCRQPGQEPFSTATVKHILGGIASGMAHLHSFTPPILHHDLKPDNVLVFPSGSKPDLVDPKIADFGLASGSGNSTTIIRTDRRRGFSNHGAGTLAYKAPECFETGELFGMPSEVFAFGITAWEVLTARIPWEQKGEAELICEIVVRRGRPLLAPHEAASPIGKMTQKCWAHEMNERPTFDKLLQDELVLNASVQQDDGGRFVAKSLQLGHVLQALRGLHSYLGLDDATLAQQLAIGVDAIVNEIKRSGTDEDRANLAYVLHGIACEETSLPEHVKTSCEKGSYHGGNLAEGDFDYGHDGMCFDDFMKLREVKVAQLDKAHVLALRLYTSTTYRSINTAIRKQLQPNPFRMTIHYLSDGIRKLRAVKVHAEPWAINEELLLYRGLRDVRVTDSLVKLGGCELAPMSTSASREVVHSYAKSTFPLLLTLRTRGINRGASLSFLSMYPKEEEFLYPPLTYLIVVGQPQTHEDGRTVVLEVEPQVS